MLFFREFQLHGHLLSFFLFLSSLLLTFLIRHEFTATSRTAKINTQQQGSWYSESAGI